MKQDKTWSQTLQLRISVKDVKPEIWRKLLVSSDITLARLHAILQVLMGWRDNHLYAFVIDEKRYSPPSEHDKEIGKQYSIRTKLSRIFGKGVVAVTYEYDFGDRWEIDVCNEPRSDGFQQRQPTECIEGCRHGPIEDSGGSREYMEKVRIYGNPRHKRYHEVREFVGPMFDPESFNLRQTNEMLKELG
ncbi:MAG: plasmid pRiA4b ORF-3 family protein [Spirochaetia bacterium]